MESMEVYKKLIPTLNSVKEVEMVGMTKEVFDGMQAFYQQLFDLDEFIHAVEHRILKMVEDNPLEYADEFGEFGGNEDDLLDLAIDAEYESQFEGEAPFFLINEVCGRYNFDIWSKVYDMVKETYRDVVLYNRDPMAYYGLSQSDFL